MNDRFPAWLVTDSSEGVSGSRQSLRLQDLPRPAGPSAVIRVEWSSLNYKDALACRGHRGVISDLPHVPGIDCSGEVVSCDNDSLQPGDRVLVTGYGLGTSQWGGYAGLVRVPVDWAVPLPAGFTAREAMVYGTAGFTAAQCVWALRERIVPDAGEVLVTGATGGVGCLATAILARLGYRVVASTGKRQLTEALRSLGASRVVSREEVADSDGKPLLSQRWAGAVDTVGGETLSAVLRATSYRGVVAACGLVAGAEMTTSLYPFLLRGVTLAGIDSAKCPHPMRREIWDRLAGDWRVALPDEWVRVVAFDCLQDAVERILNGGAVGRTLVRPVESIATQQG